VRADIASLVVSGLTNVRNGAFHSLSGLDPGNDCRSESQYCLPQSAAYSVLPPVQLLTTGLAVHDLWLSVPRGVQMETSMEQAALRRSRCCLDG